LQSQYFGEMSLLTSDPRSATITTSTSAVIYEVAKRVIEPILLARPKVTHELAQTVAMRQLQNQTTLALDKSPSSESHRQTFTAQMLNKIRDFFNAH